jgi:predicted  nucleic acid-binding Zn ribbon protein
MLQYLKYHTNEQNEVIALSHKVTLGDIATGAIALNWNIDLTPQNSKKIWQNGGTFGFSTCSVVYPEQNICIILLTNEADREAQKDLGIIAEMKRLNFLIKKLNTSLEKTKDCLVVKDVISAAP